MEPTLAARAVPAESPSERRRAGFSGPVSGVLRFARRKPIAAFGGLVIAVLILVAIVGPMVVNRDPAATAPANRLQPPSSQYPMGTDHLGRDIFARIVHGARVSVAVGFGAVTIGMLLATLIGVISGYYGGKLDIAIQRVVDIAIAFPFLVILITVVQVLPRPTDATDLGLFELDASAQKGLYVVITLGVLLSFNASRIVRGSVLSMKSSAYVESARAIGASDLRILLRHVLPNIIATVIVLATVYLGSAILIEASIAYLGFGLPPTIPSWGLMLSEGRNFIQTSLNVTIWPGLTIALTVFAFNMLGDGLRDVLDPRLRT